jgi:hypothetical protein
MLLQNPQLAYALLQAQIVMKIVIFCSKMRKSTDQRKTLISGIYLVISVKVHMYRICADFYWGFFQLKDGWNLHKWMLCQHDQTLKYKQSPLLKLEVKH